MSKNCLCGEMRKGGLMALIAGVQDHQYINPPKLGGQYEPLESLMNDYEKKTFTVMYRLEHSMLEKIELVNSKEVLSNRGLLESEIRELRIQYFTVRNLMFTSIRDRLNIWEKPLDVSNGFKIVIPEFEEIARTILFPQEVKDAIEAVIRKAASAKEDKTKDKVSGVFPDHSTLQ